MKKLVYAFLPCLLLVASCSENNELKPSKGVMTASVTVEDCELVFNDDELSKPEKVAGTRSGYVWESSGSSNIIKFSWSNGDRILVSTQEGQGFNIYSLESGASSNSASFRGEGFDLKKDANYYGYYPYLDAQDGDAPTVSRDKTQIPITYRNQRQVRNDDMSHLGNFDYQAAYSTVSEDGHVNFKFKRLGCFVRVRASFKDFADDKRPTQFTKFEMVPDFNYTFRYDYTLDLTNAGSSVADYAPGLVPVDDATSKSSVFEVGLGTKDGAPMVVDSKNEYLVMYFMFPPTADLMNKPLYGRFTAVDPEIPSQEKTYYIPLIADGPFAANGYGTFGKKATPSGTLNLAVTVNRDWQVGDTQSETRGAGDPGYDSELQKPTSLCIYTCKDGKYLSTTSITSIPAEHWTESGSEWIYNQGISIGYETASSLDVYIVAANGTCPVPSASLTTDTEKAVVAGLTTSISSEAYFRDLYAYHYEVVPASPVKTVTLYHVAAKMDVQWNNKTASALSGSVSVDNLPDTGIKLFDPTNNAATGSWSPSVTINEGTCWNGRHVFYVPQITGQTYTITTGSKSGAITFDAPVPATDAKTAWFKANITVQ